MSVAGEERTFPKWSRSLDILIAYFAVSILTLPFMDSIWLGELPLLAVIQLPKIWIATWVRRHAVMDSIKLLGFSQGSYSPDFIMARPWGLLIAYLAILTPILAAIAWRARLSGRIRSRAAALLVLAFLDFWATLALAGGPGFSIY